jgi:hypothetical protein
VRFWGSDGAERVFTLLVAAIVIGSLTSCAAAEAVLPDADCNQTDSTITCCCGASSPTQSTERINAAIPKLPTRVEKEKWRKDLCTPAYERCIQVGGGSIEGRVWDETQCKACFDACIRYGEWPKEANGKPCPGA